MANNQNLRSFATLTPEQRREISRKGGQASGAARRRKRELAEEELAYRLADLMESTRRMQIVCAQAAMLHKAVGSPRGARSRHKYIYRY